MKNKIETFYKVAIIKEAANSFHGDFWLKEINGDEKFASLEDALKIAVDYLIDYCSDVSLNEQKEYIAELEAQKSIHVGDISINILHSDDFVENEITFESDYCNIEDYIEEFPDAEFDYDIEIVGTQSRFDAFRLYMYAK